MAATAQTSMPVTAKSTPSRWSLAEAVLPLFIVALAAIAGLIEPRFLSLDNLLNLGRQMVPLLIISLGQAIAIIRGGLDLSLAAVLSLSGVAGVLVMESHGIPAGIAVMLATGMVTGTVSGFIIAYFRTTPLVVTLGMLSIAQALALILSGGVPIYDVPSSYVQAVGFDAFLGIPVVVWIAAAATLAMALLLRRTVFGRYVYAIGSNASAAAKSGVNVRLYTMLVYTVSGLSAAIGAVVLTAWVGSAQPIAAPNITLESLAAVVLGGVALTGGSGGVRQVFLGVVVLSMLSNIMNMIGVSAYFQTLAVGVVIIVAVILDRFRRNQRD
ncbi:ABC transporter permease [Hydrogenophaga sp.]|jgi:ribose/xylose/arabinose/galactoside ABC-type transport system permease subunit|uniref:ABC transporter permease n=1 Tax=Hydrogenophaga sp. TaxID=1904254 RepID=UPI003F72A0F6